MARLCILALLCCAWPPCRLSAQVVIRGSVVDESTSRPIADVHILVRESGRGTITNQNGRFELLLAGLPATLRIRHVGYVTQELRVTPNSPREYSITLSSSVISLDEVIVAGEDFADNVMRRVIRRKRAAWANVDTYSARAYSRTSLIGDAARDAASAMSIRESVFDQYYRESQGTREVLRSMRETDDGYLLFGLEPFGRLPNFYNDQVELAGRSFMGPTHPDALDTYKFTFAQVRSVDGRVIYDIYVAPRTDARITLIGTISVLADEDVIIESNLRPARHVAPTPPLVRWDVYYLQQFADADEIASGADSASTPWMPVATTAQGRIAVSDGTRQQLSARLTQVSVVSEYTINEPVPREWFESDTPLQVDSSTVYEDYLFTLGANAVALTPMELRAYDLAVRRKEPVLSAFRVEGPRDLLSILTPRISEPDGPAFAWPMVYGYTPYFRYNRVDGLLSGIGQIFRPTGRTLVDWKLAQATGWRTVRYRFRYERRLTETFYAGAILEKDAFSSLPYSLIGPVPGSLGQLVGRGDYHDYHSSIRKSVTARLDAGLFRVRGAIRHSKVDTLDRRISSSWPSGHGTRSNPAPRVAGQVAEFEGSIGLGAYRQPYASKTPTRVGMNAVVSPAGVLDSGGYVIADFEAGMSFNTIGRTRQQPAHADLLVRLGRVRGRSPYGWAIDGSAGGFAPFGVLRASPDRPIPARQGAAFFWRHDFARIPFDVLGLDGNRKLGATISVHGGHALLETDDTRIWKHEAGFGLSGVLGLPLEFQLTRMLDDPRWIFGFSLRH